MSNFTIPPNVGGGAYASQINTALGFLDDLVTGLQYDIAEDQFTITGGMVFNGAGIAIGAGYTEVPSGRKLAIVADENFGIEVVHTADESDGIASYNKGNNAAAFYAELAPDSTATDLGMGYRVELRKEMVQPVGFIAFDVAGGARGFWYLGQTADGRGFVAENLHEATPAGPFTGLEIVDRQQSGAANNAGVVVQHYQDNIDGFVLHDSQRSDTKAVQIRKAGGGGQVWVNDEAGVNRAVLYGGSTGARGVLKMWDDAAGAYAYAYINGGAWVIQSPEPN